MECRLNGLRGKSIALMKDIILSHNCHSISPNCGDKRPTKSPVQSLSPFFAPNFPKPDIWDLNFMEKCITVKPNFLQEPEIGKTKLKIWEIFKVYMILGKEDVVQRQILSLMTLVSRSKRMMAT